MGEGFAPVCFTPDGKSAVHPTRGNAQLSTLYFFLLPSCLTTVRHETCEGEGFSAKAFTHNSINLNNLHYMGEGVKAKNRKQRTDARVRGENAQVFTPNGEEDEKSSRFGKENRHALLLFRFILC